jgi:hypothetical protein
MSSLATNAEKLVVTIVPKLFQSRTSQIIAGVFNLTISLPAFIWFLVMTRAGIRFIGCFITILLFVLGISFLIQTDAKVYINQIYKPDENLTPWEHYVNIFLQIGVYIVGLIILSILFRVCRRFPVACWSILEILKVIANVKK